MMKMDTTELFEFCFVDREQERQILNNFFNNKQETTLWIKGASGLGKTTFFNYMFEKWNQYSLCYINIRTDTTSIEIISDFIIQLQQYANMDFISQFKNHYKKFYNNIYKTIKVIPEMIFPQISNVISVLLDTSYTIVTNNGENKNCIEVIIDYISDILKRRKLCICIDNFSRCDLQTASIFFQIFKTFLLQDYFRSCIITTTEELSDKLKNAIYRNLPYTEIKITELNEYNYFGQILNSIFDLSNIEKEDLQYIYQKCNGSPQKLSIIISKLLDQSGIIINSQKAIIDKKSLYLILQKQYINFDEQDFNQIQKWILFSYLCLSEKVEIKKVKDCALFISKKFFLFNAFDSKTFNQELLNLVSSKILKYNTDNTISPCHDSEYKDLLDIFENSQFKDIFHQYAYEFLTLYYPDEKALLCRHAREVEIPEWINMNFRYGKFLTHNKQYYDAQKIFMHLNQHLSKLHVVQVLFIAINSYETGNYRLAIDQLNFIRPEILHFKKVKYYYFFYLGKSYNNIGNVGKGADMLENALAQTTVGSKEYVNALNVLHMYYLEIPKKHDMALQLFTDIKDNYKEKYPQVWANTIRGCHNFMNNDDSLKLLFEAEAILDNELEKAFVKTTIGFVYIRMNQLEKAENQFETACKVIKRLKIHEYSYAMNNFAICCMLKDEYQKAKDILLEALLWNRTEYGKLAIQCHLLTCAICLNQIDEAKDYYKYLETYIDKQIPNDPIIKRKIYLNLAIASRKMGGDVMEQSFLKKAKAYVENSSSEWRYFTLIGASQDFHKPIPNSKYQRVMDFEPWFLVYAHD